MKVDIEKDEHKNGNAKCKIMERGQTDTKDMARPSRSKVKMKLGTCTSYMLNLTPAQL